MVYAPNNLTYLIINVSRTRLFYFSNILSYTDKSRTERGLEVQNDTDLEYILVFAPNMYYYAFINILRKLCGSISIILRFNE